jgi:predicted dehydrogenase
MNPNTKRSKQPTRTGVIGVGTMGHHHARVYDELPAVDLIGVVDSDTERADAIASKYGVQAMNRKALLNTVDSVSVAVPTPYHYENVLMCVEEDVDVLVEKPFVGNPEKGRSLISEIKNQLVQVGHVERFNPAVCALDKIISDLDVITVNAQRLSPPPDRPIKDSAVLDLMIHDIDILLSIIDGEIESAAAVGVQNNRYASAQLQFANGVIANLTASRLTHQKVRTLSITAHSCRVDVDYADQTITIHRRSPPECIEANGDIRYRHESTIEQPMVQNGEPLKKELASFVSAASEGAEPVVTAEDGLRALELAHRIDELAAEQESLMKRLSKRRQDPISRERY